MTLPKTEREINLSDAALRERAMEYERCDEWHYKHNPVEREKVKRLLASYIALRDAAHAEQRERDAKIIPVTWLDPLLTGPDAALQGHGPWGCPDIERLFTGLANRIRAQDCT